MVAGLPVGKREECIKTRTAGGVFGVFATGFDWCPDGYLEELKWQTPSSILKITNELLAELGNDEITDAGKR